MALIIATGSNTGDSFAHLERAKHELQKHFKLVAQSRVYTSKAVDYTEQPDFLNQVLQFEEPSIPPEQIMQVLLKIEIKLGRVRDVPKGPRTIDLDLLFLGLKRVDLDGLDVPHPRLFERSFVVLPLQELPYYETLSQNFTFSDSFEIVATPIIN